ncbi:MAG: excinuclease ABC subunit UvrA [Microgenomates group bacterium]
MDQITIKGARQHNLKNIDVVIPKDKLVIITGVSGSGKSSLAFDTLYAEGQRRYVESLSAYARQFLGIMEKPDVDLIDGLSPAISIDQKSSSHNPRSTVGTITEVYDYLRLLFARIGHPHCPNCKVEITKLSLDEITERIIKMAVKQAETDKSKPHAFQLLSPIVRQKKGEFKDLFNNIRTKGFFEVRVDGKLFDLQKDDISLLKANKHSIDAVIDQFNLSSKELKDDMHLSLLRSRLSNSIEQALALSDGLVILKGEVEQLFSENFSCPNCNLSLPDLEPRIFSFNSPLGACAKCKGLGTIFKIDPDLIINKKLSINEGGILPFNKVYFQDTWYVRLLKRVCEEEGIDMNKPLGDLDEKQMKLLLYGTETVYRVVGKNRFGNDTAIHEKFLGLVAEFEKRFFETQVASDEIEVGRYMREEQCTQCKGRKLKPEVLAVTIDGKNIMDICDESISLIQDYVKNDLPKKLNRYETEVGVQILREIETRVSFLRNVGLAYLTLNRAAKTLSGGELQRIRLASQIGSGLTGVLYVLDEPSIGLHPRDVDALIQTLKHLRDIGNTVVIVEHDKETIENADYMIELGPKAGKEGGHLVAAGTLPEIKKNEKSLTGAYLSGTKKIPISKRKFQTERGWIEVHGATQFNLKSVDLKLPLGNMIAITGVSGSGKSTLITETLYPALKYYLDGYYQETMGDFTRLVGQHNIERVYLVDQSPIGRTPRSNPATYTGMFDEIREIFAETTEARARGFKKGRFSFNMKGGRCEKCQGAGVIKIQMQFLPDVYVTCDVCEGHRYNKETLEVKFKGKTIYEVLNMTIVEAADFFKNHIRIYQKLAFLKDVGLGYVTMGQPAPTFSGGEAQRIKLAHELSRRDTGKTLYILDEPTTGLHMFDTEKLLHTLHKLVDGGNTVVVIEHNMDIIKNCQYIVDLGPDGGDGGGTILYQGELPGIMKVKGSHTARYLK